SSEACAPPPEAGDRGCRQAGGECCRAFADWQPGRRSTAQWQCPSQSRQRAWREDNQVQDRQGEARAKAWWPESGQTASRPWQASALRQVRGSGGRQDLSTTTPTDQATRPEAGSYGHCAAIAAAAERSTEARRVESSRSTGERPRPHATAGAPNPAASRAGENSATAAPCATSGRHAAAAAADCYVT